MTTPTGTITMLDVIEELDGSPTPRLITLNDADVRGLAEVPAGQISMDDLRGKSSIGPVVTGNVTIATITFVGIGFVDGNAGSVSNVVGKGVFLGIVMNQLYTADIGKPTFVQGITTADYSDKLLSLRIIGNGRDETHVFESPFGDATHSGGITAQEGSIFTGADVGLTYAFELIGTS